MRIRWHRDRLFSFSLQAGIAQSSTNCGQAFWGSWGEEVEDIILCCPQTGNKDRRDFCNNVGAYDPTDPDSDPGDVNSICAGDDGFDELLCGRDKNDEYDICFQVKTVAVSQGIFVQDSDDDSITAVAKANVTEGTDFIF